MLGVDISSVIVIVRIGFIQVIKNESVLSSVHLKKRVLPNVHPCIGCYVGLCR